MSHTVAKVLLLAVALLSISCENRARIESTTDTIADVVADPAVRYGWTRAGFAQSYTADGFLVKSRVLNIWRSSRLSVTVGSLEKVFKPYKVTPTIVPNSVTWDVEFRNLDLFVPVRIESDAGIHLCRARLTGPKHSLRTVVALKNISGHGGKELKLAATPSITHSSWSVAVVGECDTHFPAAFDFNQRLIEYVNDAFILSLGNHFEALPPDPLSLLTSAQTVRSASSYPARRGASFFTPDFQELDIVLNSDGVEMTLPVEVGNKRAPCAPMVGLDTLSPSASGMTVHPLAVAKARGVDFGMTMDVAFLSYLAAAYVRSGLGCTGFEAAVPNVNDFGVVATDSLKLAQIGISGLPFADSTTISFVPRSLPTLSLRPSSKQVVLTFPSLEIDVYSDIYGVATRLATLTFSAKFEVQLTVKRNQIYQEVLQATVSNVRLEDTVGVPVAGPTLETWLRRALVLVTNPNHPFSGTFLNITPYEWKSVQLESDSVTLVGEL